MSFYAPELVNIVYVGSRILLVLIGIIAAIAWLLHRRHILTEAQYHWLVSFEKIVTVILTMLFVITSFMRDTVSKQQLAKLTSDEKRAECVLSQMTSRHFSPDQTAKLVSKLAAFPGIIVNTWRFTGTPCSQSVISFEIEKMDFAGQLTDVFQAANWKTNGVIVRQNPFPDVRQSVFIMQRQGADSRIDKAMKALVAGLDEDCIKVDVGSPFPDNGDYGQQIFVDKSGMHPDTVQADIISAARPQKNPDISILVGVALQSW